jgi:hypothetical protein
LHFIGCHLGALGHDASLRRWDTYGLNYISIIL